jgi:hypothetical protein
LNLSWAPRTVTVPEVGINREGGVGGGGHRLLARLAPRGRVAVVALPRRGRRGGRPRRGRAAALVVGADGGAGDWLARGLRRAGQVAEAREDGVSLAQKIQVGPCIPVGAQDGVKGQS